MHYLLQLSSSANPDLNFWVSKLSKNSVLGVQMTRWMHRWLSPCTHHRDLVPPWPLHQRPLCKQTDGTPFGKSATLCKGMSNYLPSSYSTIFKAFQYINIWISQNKYRLSILYLYFEYIFLIDQCNCEITSKGGFSHSNETMFHPHNKPLKELTISLTTR